ncbi:hypothetical protein D3C83_44610 [compost metagenome]
MCPIATNTPFAGITDSTPVFRFFTRMPETPLPLPLVNQIACCLFGAGHTDDMNQAKAVVAVEAGNLAAA